VFQSPLKFNKLAKCVSQIFLNIKKMNCGLLYMNWVMLRVLEGVCNMLPSICYVPPWEVRGAKTMSQYQPILHGEILL
jgi:hypothetical protein